MLHGLIERPLRFQRARLCKIRGRRQPAATHLQCNDIRDLLPSGVLGGFALIRQRLRFKPLGHPEAGSVARRSLGPELAIVMFYNLTQQTIAFRFLSSPYLGNATLVAKSTRRQDDQQSASPTGRNLKPLASSPDSSDTRAGSLVSGDPPALLLI